MYFVEMCSEKVLRGVAPAKVNLALHVCRRLPESDGGYHTVDSLAVFPDIGDTLTLMPADNWHLDITGPFAVGLSTTDNLVLKAAQLASPTQPYAIILEKNLPVAAGIGGGSADAAAVLRLLEYNNADAQMLGADVAACLFGQPVRMQGIGEVLTPVAHMPNCAIVLVNPGQPVLTGPVFTALPQQTRTALPEPLPFNNGFSFEAMTDWLAQQTRNDLQAVATKQYPVIQECLDVLAAHSPFCRMSGSGGTCFGLFKTLPEAREAVEALKRSHPSWWVQAGQI